MALEKHGYRVGRARICQEIGKGGDNFVPSLLGGDADEEHGTELRGEHARAFEHLAAERGIRPAPGAEQLLIELRRRGLKTALATSSTPAHLAAIEAASGVKWRELVDVVTHADDVEATKPDPDIVDVALAKLGLGPAECAFLGDTPWDGLAATAAGVTSIAVTFGGNEASVLFASGARDVRADTAEVLAQLDRVLTIASPGKARITPALLEGLMVEALREAEIGVERAELPIGVVLADGSGQVLARGRSRVREMRNPFAHGELEVLQAALGKLDSLARNAILVTTLEPSPLIVAAAMDGSVDTIAFGLALPRDAGCRRVVPSNTGQRQICRIIADVLEPECRRLFQRWQFRADRSQEYDPIVKAALGEGTANAA
jgi:HAD superfamily hydrolase (TIGR01509 family)